MSENLPAHSKVLLFLYSVTLSFSPFSLVLLSPVSQWEKIHCPKGSSFLFFCFFFFNPQSLSGSRNKVDFFFFCHLVAVRCGSILTTTAFPTVPPFFFFCSCRTSILSLFPALSEVLRKGIAAAAPTRAFICRKQKNNIVVGQGVI